MPDEELQAKWREVMTILSPYMLSASAYDRLEAIFRTMATAHVRDRLIKNFELLERRVIYNKTDLGEIGPVIKIVYLQNFIADIKKNPR